MPTSIKILILAILMLAAFMLGKLSNEKDRPNTDTIDVVTTESNTSNITTRKEPLYTNNAKTKNTSKTNELALKNSTTKAVIELQTPSSNEKSASRTEPKNTARIPKPPEKKKIATQDDSRSLDLKREMEKNSNQNNETNEQHVRLVPIGDISEVKNFDEIIGLLVDSKTGKSLQAEDYKDQNVLLGLWAVWCKSCLTMARHLAVHQRWSGIDEQNIKILLISVDETIEDVRYAINSQLAPANYPIGYPQNVDANKTGKDEIRAIFQPRGMPTTLLLNKDKKVVKRYNGYSEQILKSIETDISQLASQQKSQPRANLTMTNPNIN